MALQSGSSRLSTGAKGTAIVEWRGDEVFNAVENIVAERLDAAAVLVVAEAKKSMGPGSSKAGKPGPKRTRSAPGEAPASQFDVLRKSISRDAPSKLVRRVGTNEDYGLFLELGTKTIRPRPWLEVARLRVELPVQPWKEA